MTRAHLWESSNLTLVVLPHCSPFIYGNRLSCWKQSSSILAHLACCGKTSCLWPSSAGTISGPHSYPAFAWGLQMPTPAAMLTGCILYPWAIISSGVTLYWKCQLTLRTPKLGWAECRHQLLPFLCSLRNCQTCLSSVHPLIIYLELQLKQKETL